MVNRLYNKQVSPKGYKKGGKVPPQLTAFVMAKKSKTPMDKAVRKDKKKKVI